MLDSGVFSAWNRRETLDLKKYIAYIQAHKKWLWSYVNMDKIPGEYGKRRTSDQVEESARVGYDNLQKMKGAGLTPIPVFHQGERFAWFERMIADGERYIGVSTAKDLMPADQRRWLDHVFSMITTSKGVPLIKTHGFGITNPKFLFRYPWFTCDSTTWSMTPGYGQIIVPLYVGGKPDYRRVPLRIAVSGVAHANPASQKRQFEGMGPASQDAIRRFLNEEVGISLVEARYGTTKRRHALLVYYKNLEVALRGIRFTDRTMGFAQNNLSAKLKPMGFDGVTLIYATTLSNEWSDLLNKVGTHNRLLSYYELMDRDTSILQRYVEDGACAPYVAKPKKQKWTSETYLNHRALRLMEHLATGEFDGTDNAA